MTEIDPTGLNPHSPGAKLDAGKPRPELVLGAFAFALMEVAKVGTFGAIKYTDHGWLDVTNGVERYRDAAQRHWLYRAMGEELDDQSGLLHEAHEIWNKLAALELKLRNAVGRGNERPQARRQLELEPLA